MCVLEEQLCLLPCFESEKIIHVNVLTGGLSRSCFCVTTEKQQYFAKNLANESTEQLAAIFAGEQGVAPEVIYSDESWLINKFISGQSLANSNLSQDEKLNVMTGLLLRCHQQSLNSGDKKLAAGVPKLAINETLSQLLKASKLNAIHRESLLALSVSIQKELTQHFKKEGQRPLVFCHGDANFSNAINAENKTENLSLQKLNYSYQLIDFECASLAPIEYELAMLLAINELEIGKLELVAKYYTRHALAKSFTLKHSQTPLSEKRDTNPKNSSIAVKQIVDNLPIQVTENNVFNKGLVMRYFELSLIINALWYLSKFHQGKAINYKNLANRQFLLLAQHYPKTHIVID